MKKTILTLSILLFATVGFAQLSPAITSWLQNNTIMGRHYLQNNFTPIQDIVMPTVSLFNILPIGSTLKPEEYLPI